VTAAEIYKSMTGGDYWILSSFANSGEIAIEAIQALVSLQTVSESSVGANIESGAGINPRNRSGVLYFNYKDGLILERICTERYV